MTSSLQSILVLGLGELGSEIINQLLANKMLGSVEISFLIRDPSISNSQSGTLSSKKQKIGQLRAKGVKPVFADITQASEAELAAIFQNYDAVISCNGYSMPLGTQVKITRSVLLGKVKLYLPWQFGVDYDAIGYGSGQDVFDEQLEVRKLIRNQSTTNWIIISTGIFMSYLFEPFFGVVNGPELKIHGLGSWDNRLVFTTVEDISVLTAKVILEGYNVDSKIKNEVAYVAGDSISFADIAITLEKFYRKEFWKELFTIEQLERQLQQNPEGEAKYRLVFAKGVGTSWDKSITYNEKIKYRTTTVHSYLVQHNPLHKYVYN